jgi:hypothetical protein
MRTHQTRLWLTALAVSLVTGTLAVAENAPLFTIMDPRGDDFGNGTLVYPLREDLNPGDLDLMSLSVRLEKGGAIFEATMARRVLPPGRRTIDEIGTSLDAIARFGFYTLNIDIYIDTDRVPNSGSTLTLPGRRAAIAPQDAWEKAICLTPRPFEAREQLKSLLEQEAKKQIRASQGRVDSSEKQSIETGVAKDVADGVFFPTLIWVSGAKISFFVPESFLGAPPSPKWGYVIAVTGAKIDMRFDLGPALGTREAREANLMVIPLEHGKSKEAFGGGQDEDNLQTPLVDIVVPPGMTQEGILKDYDLRTDRPVQLRAVVPAELK